jgi:antitoxin component YwqK of YwqJK toxin-antitoxin module
MKKLSKNYGTCPNLSASKKLPPSPQSPNDISLETCVEFNKENFPNNSTITRQLHNPNLDMQPETDSFVHLSSHHRSSKLNPSTTNTHPPNQFSKKQPPTLHPPNPSSPHNLKFSAKKPPCPLQPGKEFYDSGQVKYEGTYLGSSLSREGNGISYYENGVPQYRGMFRNNIYHDKGIEYYQNGGVRYIGYYLEGVYWGHGIEYFESGGVRYKGLFREGRYNDVGILFYENGSKKLESFFEDGVANGLSSVFYWESGGVGYKGQV